MELIPTTPPARPTYNVPLNLEELSELVKLIDDEDDLDEVLLSGLRRKLVHKTRLLRSRLRKAEYGQARNEERQA